jgi:hypothetical protein
MQLPVSWAADVSINHLIAVEDVQAVLLILALDGWAAVCGARGTGAIE